MSPDGYGTYGTPGSDAEGRQFDHGLTLRPGRTVIGFDGAVLVSGPNAPIRYGIPLPGEPQNPIWYQTICARHGFDPLEACR